MILFAKHLAIMSLALLAVPILGRLMAGAFAKRSRIRRPGFSLLYFLTRLAVALLIPVLAQGAFALLGHRLIALALAGAVYGALFGDAQDFPPAPAVLWGALGGVAAAFLFGFYPPTSEARSLCVAVFAVAPLLAYRPLVATVRSRMGSSGLLMPSRRILR
ncbi:hypothetical protein EON82_17815 [bacterium]|nr:MAG: hypothetical protein EON82_17815 [bacterium]